MDARFDANHILDEKFVPHDVAGTVAIDEFIVGDGAFAVQAPASYQLVLTALDEGIFAQGKVSLPVEATCVRCLEPFELIITASVENTFYYEPVFDEDGDSLPQVDEYGYIDLEGELVEDLIIETPYAPLHDPQCKGICPLCGTNRNTNPCTCADDLVDYNHPFSQLDALLDNREE